MPSRPKSRWAIGEVEDRHRRPTERAGAADRHDPCDAQVLLGATGDHPDRLPHRVVVAFGGVGVDCHCPGAFRPRALHEREGVEALAAVRVDAKREPRGAADREHLAFAPDELGAVRDPPVGDGDTRQRANLREQRFRERGGGAAVVFGFPFASAADRALARDDHVGALVDFVEHRPERRFDGVGEDVGAADHRHAEDDGGCGEGRAQLACGEAFERDADHVRPIRPRARSSRSRPRRRSRRHRAP